MACAQLCQVCKCLCLTIRCLPVLSLFANVPGRWVIETTKAGMVLSTYLDLSRLFSVQKVRKHSTNSGDAVAVVVDKVCISGTKNGNNLHRPMAVVVTVTQISETYFSKLFSSHFIFVLVNSFYICSFKVQILQKKLLRHLSDMLIIPRVVKSSM